MITMDTGSTDPAFNAAVEELLVKRFKPGDPGCFLLWRNRASVIIGRHQSVTAEVRLRLLREKNIELVRRMSGGGAVFHDPGNVNFSFIVAQKGINSITHRALLEPMIAMFAELGLDVEMRGKNNLSVVGGGKFSGMASRQMPNKFLLHGTLLFDTDLDLLEKALWIDPDKHQTRGVASVRMAVTNLKDHLAIDLPTLMDRLRATYRVQWAELDDELKREADRLVAEKYRQRGWNFDRSPPSDLRFEGVFNFGKLRLRIGTDKNRLTIAEITGDLDNPLAIGVLERVLIGLPADDSRQWAAAWRQADLARIFPDLDIDALVEWAGDLL